MAGIIVIIIVVIAMIVKVSQQAGGKNKENSGSRPSHAGNSTTRPTAGSSGTGSRSRPAAGSSGTGSGSRPAAASSGTGSRPRPEKKREQSGTPRPDITMAAGVEADDGDILSAAKINSYVTGMDNEMDSREDLMKPVYDLMVTGPDTTIPSGRDFVAEATDMLNSFMWSDKAE